MTDLVTLQKTVDAMMRRGPVMPVLTIERAEDALPLAEALLAGGISVAEVTLRTGAALAAMEQIAKSLPEMAVAAGTVLEVEQFAQVRDAGATLAISPGYTDALLAASLEIGMPYLPAAATASEVITLRQRGFKCQKFFPATVAGGVPALKAIGAPIQDVHFCPTGGISESNAADFLALKNVTCVGGSWIAAGDLVKAGDWAEITRRAKAASQIR